MRTIRTILLAATAVYLAGCGQPGVPLPPSLHLPVPVKDLRAMRVGDKVTLTWTVPYETTDRETIRKPGTMRVCRTLTAEDECGKALAEVPAKQGAELSREDHPLVATFIDTLTPELQMNDEPLAQAIYTIEALNDAGKSAGFGNRVDIPLVRTTAPPHGVTARVEADGVHIHIPPQAMQSEPDARIQYWYQVTRTNVPAGNGTPDLVGEAPAVGDVNLLDKSIEWEKQYAYTVTPITWVETQPNGKRLYSVPGESAPPIAVATHDIFPPAVPTGLQAVYTAEQKTIDLTWAPNTDLDLAGYNIYKWVTPGTPQKINTELVKTPTYRDPVSASGEYTYAVSAVDLRGNESAKSAPASEKVPAE